MKYAFIYMCVLLSGYAGYAQVNWPPAFRFWTDSMNVRLHITNSFSNLSHAYGSMQWHPEQMAFRGNLPSLLKFDAIIPTNYRQVKWEKVEVCSYDQIPKYSGQTSPEMLVHMLDTTFAHRKVLSTGVVTYDSDGYLMNNVVMTDDKEGQRRECDTTTYSYEWQEGKLQNMQVGSLWRKHYDKPQFSSINCGTIKKGKLDIYGRSTITYSFNTLDMPVQIETTGVEYANKCTLSGPWHTIKLIEYDETGRMVSYMDSSVTSKHADRNVRYAYEEIPFDTILNDTATYNQEYSVLRMPQLSRWLLQKNGAALLRRDVQTTTYLQYNYKAKKHTYNDLPPLITNTREEWIIDEKRDTWVHMTDRNRNGWLQLYQRGHDSDGVFRGEYTVHYLPQADAAKYDHNEPRMGITRQFGCVIEMDYKYPRKGSILATGLNYTERNVYGSTNGWHLTTYNRPRPNWQNWTQDDLEWAPEAWRPMTGKHSYTDMVLCDQNGLPRYVGVNHYLYRLTYE